MHLLRGYKASIRLGFAALFLSISIPIIIAATAGAGASRGEVGDESLDSGTSLAEPVVPLALLGARSGIRLLDSSGAVETLVACGEVRALLPTPLGWYALSARGILYSADGRSWEERNEGLPFKTLKIPSTGGKSFEQQPQELKDLAFDPLNPSVLVTATKDAVYLSRDAGLAWKSLGLPVATNGIKAVAVASLDGTRVFAASSIYGPYLLDADTPGAVWKEFSTGLLTMNTSSWTDEVSDILVAPSAQPEGPPVVYLSQGFKLALFQLDWALETWIPLHRYDEPVGMLDALALEEGTDDAGLPWRRLLFSRNGGMAQLPLALDPPPSDIEDAAALSAAAPVSREDIVQRLRSAASSAGEAVFSYAPVAPAHIVPSDAAPAPVAPALAAPALAATGPVLNELWLHADPAVEAATVRRQRQERARGHEGLYIPGGHLTNEKELVRYEKIIADHGLDAIVVDMKDDLGRLRYTSEDPVVQKLGQASSPADLSTFLPRFKEKGIWTIARIVVFKDKNLAKKLGGKYAVWDAAAKTPWQGYRIVKKTVPDPENEGKTLEQSERVYFEENWVDPYSEEVWDYVARISRELVAKGFDEIQYDYIRFPTDGINLNRASYRWQDKGMDKESALISFLRHMRESVDAPLSVDIYGANGWYRTGARTGQEVETLAHWVDIICPMYYPSHFEQGFLAQKPAEERPWRIYYVGTWRNHYIARGEALIRPFAQAFYLNVSYDRQYYGAEYIRRQVAGVREAGSPGLIYWNNGGQYKNLIVKSAPPPPEVAIPAAPASGAAEAVSPTALYVP